MDTTQTAHAATSSTREVPALGGLHHIGITVTDLQRSVRWYSDMLGMIQWMDEQYPGGRAAGLMRPGTHVFIGLDSHDRNAGEPFAPHRTGLDHLALAATTRAELDVWRTHLTGAGVACGEIAEHAEPVPCALFTFADPDGIALELIYIYDGS